MHRFFKNSLQLISNNTYRSTICNSDNVIWFLQGQKHFSSTSKYSIKQHRKQKIYFTNSFRNGSTRLILNNLRDNLLLDDSDNYSVKHEDIGRPLYFDAQATTPMVTSLMIINIIYNIWARVYIGTYIIYLPTVNPCKNWPGTPLIILFLILLEMIVQFFGGNF